MMSGIIGIFLSILRLIYEKQDISFIAICVGRVELFYSYDYFHLGGFSRSIRWQSCVSISENIFFYFICNLIRIINWLIWSNVLDIYFLFKIAWVMKSQTTSIISLLTRKTLTERKR